MTLIPIKGVRLAAVIAGIKNTDRNDVVLIEVCDSATAAAVFTRNAFCAAPVHIARAHLAEATPGYLLINS